MIEFKADSVKLGTKKVDGTIPVILDVGEYEREKLAGILLIPDGKVLNVKLEVGDD